MKIDLAEIELDANTIRFSFLDGCSRSCITIPKEDAIRIAEALEVLPKLVEALQTTQQKLDDCDGNNFAGLFRTDYYERLLSEALELFQSPTKIQHG